jgi:alkanesulfonate monooxygenase SsuD/methylene tetrahydromethanopterin reductase-like flavin-dependent oxidoreductase (luciferase family)
MAIMDQLSVVTFPWGKKRPTVEEAVQAARQAEKLGFYSINVPMVNAALRNDELFSTFAHAHILDAQVLITAMLQSTSRIRVGGDALPLPLLPPYSWAKYLATLDVMSGGRVIAGLCAGYGKEAFHAHGVSLRNRGRRSEEELEIITRLWTEDAITFDGEFYHLEDVTFEPKPIQKPHPPIWWAGEAKSVARAARYADYLDLFMPALDELRDQYGPGLRKETEKYGTKTEIAVWVYSFVTPGQTLSAEEINEKFAGYYFTDRPNLPQEVTVAGSPEQCAAKIREYQAAGVSRLVIDFQNHGVEPVTTMIEQMTLFADKVAPLLS